MCIKKSIKSKQQKKKNRIVNNIEDIKSRSAIKNAAFYKSSKQQHEEKRGSTSSRFTSKLN